MLPGPSILFCLWLYEEIQPCMNWLQVVTISLWILKRIQTFNRNNTKIMMEFCVFWLLQRPVEVSEVSKDQPLRTPCSRTMVCPGPGWGRGWGEESDHIFWPKVLSGFSVRSYRKTQTNFSANPIHWNFIRSPEDLYGRCIPVVERDWSSQCLRSSGSEWSTHLF